MTHLKKALTLFVCTLSMSAFAVQPEATFTAPTRVDFPASARPELKGVIKESIEDALLVRYFKLENRAIKMEMPAIYGWVKTKRQPNESFALENGKARSQERLSFSIFKNQEFLNDFRFNTLKGYSEMLKRKHGSTFQVLNEDKKFMVKHTFFILGNTYRIVDYKYTTPKGEERRARDYIVFIDNTTYPLMVIRHEGNEELVLRNSRSVVDSIRFSRLVDDKEEA